MAKRHQGDTEYFRELTFPRASEGVTAMTNVIQGACPHDVNHSPRRDETAANRVAQLSRLVARVQGASAPRRGSPS